MASLGPNELVPHIYCLSFHINGLVQDYSNSNVLAMELLQSCINPSILSRFILDSHIFLLGRLTSRHCRGAVGSLPSIPQFPW